MPDAYIGFGNLEVFQNPDIQNYGEQGVILPLNELIETYGVHTKKLFEELPEHTIREMMAAADGRMYFMPGFSSSVITQHRQIMWVNKGWLEAAGLDAPTTTEEFRGMLEAFKELHPGYFPMAGTEAHYSKQPYDYLMNAFIYNDINNTRLIPENGTLGFAPVRDEWREGLRYIHGLYEDGLYAPLSFTQDNQQFNQMANDSDDVLGAFLSPGVTFTVRQNSPSAMARYVGIGPVAGPDGVKLSTVFTSLPKPNGVITSACKYPEEVFTLFDLMLSEEASLMGRYGTRGEDWDFAGQGEVSIYGTPATIHITNQLWNTTQNKHLCQIGPYVSRPKFSGGVTWDGNVTDGEYMNAQAALQYKDYAPEEYVKALIYTPEEDAAVRDIRTGIEAHIRETMIAFITGEREVESDSEWDAYRREFDKLGLAEFLKAAQVAYDRMR
jgi:putative aldouronate transport system substrate-binding protein